MVDLESGMKGDVRGGGGKDRKRQVTVTAWNQWRDVSRIMGWNPTPQSWLIRRAGLCLGGISFTPEHIGQFILIGKDVVLEITGETKPCERMDEISPGLKDVLAVSMRGGVTSRVLRPGRITLWDPVTIASENPL
jgi:MOSC domain-containing protein YiiM